MLNRFRQVATNRVVLMTDYGSQEGSRGPLEKAVEVLTGLPPLSVDARHFLSGGGGRVRSDRNGFWMHAASEGFVATPEVLIVYEIPPVERRRLVAFQRQLPADGLLSFSADPEAWRNATDKRRTVECFRRAGIPQMETIALCRPTPETALDTFERLGRDVWARPRVGAGGNDVFHLTTRDQLDTAARHYAASGQDWLLSRDARNFAPGGRRHQFRVVVLHDRVLGLPFGGVDLAVENGGVVFEVNVHPTLDVPGGLESVAIPLVAAHLRLP